MLAPPEVEIRCPLDGWRRSLVVVEDLTLVVCPFCHQEEVVA